MRQKIRGLVSIGLLLSWAVSALSGFILYLAPEGQRSGRAILLFGLTKSGWMEFHTWISFFALGITLFHVIIDWKILVAVVKYLVKGNISRV
jgi:hypothetical protein